jgi:hypothetical protein
MAVILAGYPTSPSANLNGLKGETLPQVARTMKFKLTVRDNRAGGGGVVSGGDGCQADLTSVFQINTSGTSPFLVTVPNGGESYSGGSSQTVTWNVAGTNAAPVNTANVKISLSTDGGLTYPTVLLASTPNDGSESVTMPTILTSSARIKVEALNNIYFDISNANFNITVAASSFDFDSPVPATVACAGTATASLTLGTISNLGFTTPINLTASGNPAGTTVNFGTNPVTPGNSTTVTLTGTNTLAAGTYSVTVTGVAGSITKARVISFIVQAGAGPAINTQPTTQATCDGGNVTFVVVSGGTSYQWQESTNSGANWNNISGATSSILTINGVTTSQSGNLYRVLIAGQCNTTTSNAVTLTVNAKPPVALTSTVTAITPGQSTTLTISPTPPAGFTISWFLNGTLIPGATGPTYTTGVTGLGSYTAQINNTTTGCGNVSAAFSITAKPSPLLFIFPSPNNGKFTIAYYNSGGSTKRNVAIYDTRGALVLQKTFSITQSYQLLDINMMPDASGIYLVILRDALGKEVATGKVMIWKH